MNENQSIEKFWHMPKNEFNNWRRENDLPKLLSYFQNALPHFKEWQETYGIDDKKFLSIDRTSDYFMGNNKAYLTYITKINTNSIEESKFITNRSAEEYKEKAIRVLEKESIKINLSHEFFTYFYWLKKIKKISIFQIGGFPKEELIMDLFYKSWSGGNTTSSKAFLFNHPVFKLGGIKINSEQLDGRNLDFVDLDGLIITGEYGAHTTSIAYSSCRNIKFVKAKKAFVTFKKCQLENLSIIDSKIQDLQFYDSGLTSPIFKNSKLIYMKFIKSFPGGIDIQNCEFLDFYFTQPPKNISHKGLSDFYKRLRHSFQEKGNRQEAGHYYYKERYYELLDNFLPIIPNSSDFPRKAYYGSYFHLYKQWKAKHYKMNSVVKMIGKNMVATLKLFFYPHYLLKFLRKKIKLITDSFDWLVWGFGEKPGRVFIWISIILGIFSARYYFESGGTLEGNLLGSFYCSAFNFSTMGCEHRVAYDSIEGLLGATFVGIMVAGFANRTRY